MKRKKNRPPPNGIAKALRSACGQFRKRVEPTAKHKRESRVSRRKALLEARNSED